ncbi:FG-GAP-like repeat-containing protein [Luteolibacter arcticus]|uniref:FG-GAP-like repeat-containing protein n=1 Tax=Luteolibacter arcticus TaxID=1581411 RepID=A0ABT3GFQ8_9BACT|nr:FG-GAP-like repeat-containing protein [Luteolibacter arcticus]MCW1922296.1 FG-GAP-like repeat-containing protein [Luteolibacter arcticus]
MLFPNLSIGRLSSCKSCSLVMDGQKTDPRPWFALLLGSYVICGLAFLGFGRTPGQAASVVITAVVADWLLNRLFRKRGGFPWSGLITGFGLCLLLDYGSNPWLPLLPPLLAIGSKHLFTVNGRHVYNPALFGLISSMVVAGGLVSPAPAYQWGGTWAVAMFLGGLALIVFMKQIGRGWLVGSFLVFYMIQTAFRAWVMRHHVPPEAVWLGTLTAPAFFLFTFYMLTDPATSPPGKKAQIAVAAAITVIDLLFHFRQSYYTLFYAAFTVQTARFAMAWWKSRSFPDRKNLAARLALASCLGVAAFFLGRTPRGITEDPGFAWVERDLFPSEQGTVLTDIDPRLQHVGKWILSVGDAAAVADVDGDGLQDLFLTRPMKRAQDRCTLYRNTGGLTFERVVIPALDPIRNDPAEYGLPSSAVFADVDNDGDQDLFIGMGYGRSRIFRNELKESGVLSFTDATDSAGIRGHHTCLAALFFDPDRDGDLDLLLGNSMTPYLPDYDTATPLNPFRLPQPAYEGDRRMFHFMHSSWHKASNGGRNQFFRNRGDGCFDEEDIVKLGMTETHWTLSLNSADFDGDGWVDVYAASDFGPDDLYLNEGGKRFRRIEGSHFGSIGRDTYKGMNATIADFDRNGTPDIHVSNVHAPLQAEGSLLWMTERTKDGVVFHNEAASRGALNEHRFGWGAGAADLDLDGWPDMVQANGMVDDHMDRRFPKPRDYWYVNGQIARSDPEVHAYADRWGDMRGYSIWGDQANRVLLNRGGTFHEAAEITGLTRLGNTRGVALADFDNDGDADLVLTRQFDPVLFYENHRSKPAAWVGFAVSGDGKIVNHDAAGAVLEVSQGDRHWRADVLNVTGFTAQGDRRIVIGLANDPSPVKASVLWPDGSRQDLGTFESGAYHAIRKVTPAPFVEAADAR